MQFHNFTTPPTTRGDIKSQRWDTDLATDAVPHITIPPTTRGDIKLQQYKYDTDLATDAV